jgi:putative FmdB family regulatory protein
MPIYEYGCMACGRVTEVIQALSEKPLRICPHCGGKLKKRHSAPAIHFKGTGWYVTDYAGKGKAPAGEAGGAAKASEGKPEAKTEARTEPKKADKGGKKPAPGKKD